MTRYSLQEAKNGLILGGGHGIGLALVQHLASRYTAMTLHVTYRLEEKAEGLLQLAQQYPQQLVLHKVDPKEEDQVKQLLVDMAKSSPTLELVINSVGSLHDENLQPEKSLNSVSRDGLMHYFLVNAVVTPIVAKYCFPLLRKSKLALFACLSAKVGSIGDNKLGGWYGYRASKAALNMFIQNIAIEFSHRNCPCLVLAIHPGTTITELSKPYTKKTPLKLHSPEQTAANILEVIDGKSLKESGGFYSWDGSRLPW